MIGHHQHGQRVGRGVKRQQVQQLVNFAFESRANIMNGKKKPFHDRFTPPDHLRLSNAL